MKTFVLFLFEIYPRPQRLQIAQGIVANHLGVFHLLVELSHLLISDRVTTFSYGESWMCGWLSGEKNQDDSGVLHEIIERALGHVLCLSHTRGSSEHNLCRVGSHGVPEN